MSALAFAHPQAFSKGIDYAKVTILSFREWYLVDVMLNLNNYFNLELAHKKRSYGAWA